MILLLGRLLLQGAVTLLLVTLLIFAGTEVLPRDVAIATPGQSALSETLAAAHESLGLEKPAAVRYWQWLRGMATGNPRQSLANRIDIGPEIASRLINTLWLAGSALIDTRGKQG